jgi:hypothetical protein
MCRLEVLDAASCRKLSRVQTIIVVINYVKEVAIAQY